MYQALDRIRIVLVNTSHPGNIGGAARSMKTMGLSRLYLVQPAGYPSADAAAMAAGAEDVLKSARICGSLEEALTDCVLAIGTSARSRSLEWPLLVPEQCAKTLLQHSGKGDVALVFGRERSGLTNEELARCQFMTSIPANPVYSSLNLASAVQIYGYELRRMQEKDSGPQTGQADDSDEPPATGEIIERFHEHLQQTLRDIGVIEEGHPYETLIRRLRRLFNKASLTVTEVNILRGIFSAAQGRKQRRGNDLDLNT